MTTETEQDDYDSAFDEFANKKAATDGEREEDDSTILDSGQGGDDSGDDQQSDGGTDDKGGESDQGDKADEVDELEKLRQENQQWQHRYNSNAGRVSAYQRKIQELEQQLQGAQKPAASGASENPDGSGYTDEQWATLKEDFPEIAAGIEAQAKRQEQQIQALRKQVEESIGPIQQQAHESFIQSQYQILEQQHPDYADVVKQEGFKNWLDMQPAAVRALTNSEEAADAAYLLSSYKLVAGVQQRQTDETNQKRQRQLRQSQTLPSRGARKTSAVPEDDYDAAFDYYASKKASR